MTNVENEIANISASEDLCMASLLSNRSEPTTLEHKTNYYSLILAQRFLFFEYFYNRSKELKS